MRLSITFIALMWFGVLGCQTIETFDSIKDALESKALGVPVIHLDLTKSKLKAVPEEILEFHELKTLVLDKNKLDSLSSNDVDFSDSAFSLLIGKLSSGHTAPSRIHLISVSCCSSVNGAFGGISRSSYRIALTNRLCSGLPGSMTGPLSPPARTVVAVSSLRPPSALSAE